MPPKWLKRKPDKPNAKPFVVGYTPELAALPNFVAVDNPNDDVPESAYNRKELASNAETRFLSVPGVLDGLIERLLSAGKAVPDGTPELTVWEMYQETFSGGAVVEPEEPQRKQDHIDALTTKAQLVAHGRTLGLELNQNMGMGSMRKQLRARELEMSLPPVPIAPTAPPPPMQTIPVGPAPVIEGS